MTHYILQLLIFQLLFLLIYDFFLKRETFFNWNRAYLISTPIISGILPFIKIGFIQQYIPKQYIIKPSSGLIESGFSRGVTRSEVVIDPASSLSTFFTLSKTLEYIWCIGLILSFILFLYKLYTILQLRKRGVKTNLENISLITLPDTTIAFSFFNMIFIGNRLSEIQQSNILVHEKVHVREYHSFDLLFFEILRIVFWFNPLIYIYQSRLIVLQEYVADAKAIAEINKKEYYQNLLSQIFQTEKVSFINTFFNHSLTKKRILMLQKSKSKKIFQLKFLLLIPLLCCMLVYTSCNDDMNDQSSAIPKKTAPPTEIDDIMAHISVLKESITAKGNMTDEERIELEALLTKANNFSKPFSSNAVKQVETSFGTIDKAPIYPGCENLSQEEAQKCFSESIMQFIGSKFNTKLAKDLNLVGSLRMYARFIIDHTGNITDVQVRGPLPKLEDEARRVINSLPKMTPGSQDGIAVNVKYSLPIVFKVEE